jgi:hypothetical protein
VSLALETSALGIHVRFDSQEAVIEALLRLGLGVGHPISVHPPRRLPEGLFVSPVRNGWVSIWPGAQLRADWVSQLTSTLECPGVVLEVIQSRFWVAELYQDDRLLGRIELPTEAVEYDDLWARTIESLEGEGFADAIDDEERFGARMDEIAASEEYREAVRAAREDRPEPADLAPFLPPHAGVEQAWEILTAIDREIEAEGPDDEASEYAEDYLEDFASYLGIRDASWHPSHDAQILSEGDYEDDEGFPEGWREFKVVPVPQLPVLQD